LEIPIEWTNSGRVMLGASYKLKDFVELRGGGSVDQTVIKDETFIPQFMDLYTKYSFGVGIGFEINFWHLDLATTYTHHKDVDIGSLAYQNDDNLMDNLPGLYKADDFQTILGISYRF
jgi:long-subunit fatty acid transport protein